MIAATSLGNQLEFRRRKLHMSKSAVARRARVPIATVRRILSGRESSPGVSNVAAIAGALGVELRLHEIQTAQEFRKARAAEKATKLVKLVQGTMALESQAVNQQTLNDMIDQTTSELLAGPPKRLWDD
jgi:transcriptional regulator with XRE-family HTH domain